MARIRPVYFWKCDGFHKKLVTASFEVSEMPNSREKSKTFYSCGNHLPGFIRAMTNREENRVIVRRFYV